MNGACVHAYMNVYKRCSHVVICSSSWSLLDEEFGFGEDRKTINSNQQRQAK